MPLRRIVILRHAEKPDGQTSGVDETGAPDDKSLTPRGWQRAGALVRLFCPPVPPPPEHSLVPDVVFAAGIGPGSPSRRPIETVTPLVGWVTQSARIPFVQTHLKTEHRKVVDDIMTRDGIVVVAWEHNQIVALIENLPEPPDVPQAWPDDRFDMLWILDRTAAGWDFSQRPQLVLAGDSASPIT